MRPEDIGKELQPMLPLREVDHLTPDEASEDLEIMKRKFGERLEALFEKVAEVARDPDYQNFISQPGYMGPSISCDGPEKEITNYYTRHHGAKIQQGESLKEATGRYREVARIANFYIPVDPWAFDVAAGSTVSHKTGTVFEDITIGFLRQEHYTVNDGKEELQDEETKYQIESITLLQADNLTGESISPDSNLYDLARAFEDFIVIEETGEAIDIIPRYMAHGEDFSASWLVDLGYQVEDDDDRVAHAREESRRRRRKQSGSNILGGFDIPKLESAVAMLIGEVEAFKEQK